MNYTVIIAAFEFRFSEEFHLIFKNHLRYIFSVYRDAMKIHMKTEIFAFLLPPETCGCLKKKTMETNIIDRMHKWRPKMYSFVYVLMRFTRLTLKQPFFCILSMQTRLARLISTKQKNIFLAAIYAFGLLEN